MENINDLTSDDFFDLSTVVSFDEKSLDELRGHIILLNTETDASLRLGALLDGQSIDFLFGLKKRSINSSLRNKVQKIKTLLHDLTDQPYKQKGIIDFYSEVYSAILAYHNYLSSYGFCCYFCLYRTAMQSLKQRIDAAFDKLKSRLSYMKP